MTSDRDAVEPSADVGRDPLGAAAAPAAAAAGAAELASMGPCAEGPSRCDGFKLTADRIG